MKTALICTTVFVPTVLELYRQHGPDVAFFIACDKKTPIDILEWARGVENCAVLTGADQDKWKCSGLIGWNTIQRRNIALLEAIKWGAEIIVSIDDDNIPIESRQAPMAGNDYFETFEWILEHAPPFKGIKISSPTGWFDVGTLLDPISPHRGFPYDVQSQTIVSHITGARVGVAAGLCLGDPDCSAVIRIANHPTVHRVSQLLESGIVVDPNTHTVFNSQNTAFIRELAPAFFMLPGIGRHDDIYASLIMQRVMRERGLHIHFGKPFVWQQRNQHNLVKDLRSEIDGMEYIVRFSELLDGISMEKGASITEHVAQCWHEFRNEFLFLPQQTVKAALAFLEDIEGVL